MAAGSGTNYKITLSGEDKASSAINNVRKNVKSVGEEVKSANALLGSFAAGFVGAFSIGAVVTYTRQIIDAADRLDEMSERTGVAVEELNGLEYAMKMSGGTAEDLEKGLQNLNKKISEFGTGEKATVEMFRALGITATDAHGALLQLADVFPKLSKADQVRAGNELLGKSYQALVPLLAQGRAGLQGMIEEGQKLSPVTRELAAESAKFNDNLDKLARGVTGSFMPAIESVLPKLNRFLEVTIEMRKRTGSLFRSLLAQGNVALGWGEGKTLDERIKDLQKEIDDAKEWEKLTRESSFSFFDRAVGVVADSRVMSASDAIGVLEEQKRQLESLLNSGVEASAAGVNGNASGTRSLLGNYASYIEGRRSLSEQLKNDLADERKAFDDATIGMEKGSADYLKAQESYNRKVAEIRAKYAKKTPDNKDSDKIDQAYNRALENLIGIQQSAKASTEDLSKAQEALQKIMLSPEWAGMGKARQEAIKAQAEAAESALANEALSTYMKDLDKQIGEATKSTMELTTAQSALYDLMTSPEWGRLTDEQKTRAAVRLMEVDATLKQLKAQQRLAEFEKSTPSAKGQQTESDLLMVISKYQSGGYGEVGSEAAANTANAVMGEILGLSKTTEEATNLMSEFTQQAARNMQTAFADFLFDPFTDGLDGMVAGLGKAIQRMLAEAAAAQIMNSLFGADFGKSGKVSDGSWVGTALNWASALFAANGHAFAGGGVQAFARGGAFGMGEVLTQPTAFRFASGGAFRTGIAGEAGPEAALPLKRLNNGKLGVYADAAGGARPGASVVQSFTFNGNVDRQEARRAASTVSRRTLAALAQAERYR